VATKLKRYAKPFDMKRSILATFVLLGAIACNSGSSGKSDKADSAVNTQYVPNVNGNVPDTSNSVPITGDKKDTTQHPHKDTMVSGKH
jgi:hypothetical protein